MSWLRATSFEGQLSWCCFLWNVIDGVIDGYRGLMILNDIDPLWLWYIMMISGWYSERLTKGWNWLYSCLACVAIVCKNPARKSGWEMPIVCGGGRNIKSPRSRKRVLPQFAWSPKMDPAQVSQVCCINNGANIMCIYLLYQKTVCLHFRGCFHQTLEHAGTAVWSTHLCICV